MLSLSLSLSLWRPGPLEVTNLFFSFHILTNKILTCYLLLIIGLHGLRFANVIDYINNYCFHYYCIQVMLFSTSSIILIFICMLLFLNIWSSWFSYTCCYFLTFGLEGGEMNGMEWNERNCFRIFFSLSCLGVIMEEMKIFKIGA